MKAQGVKRYEYPRGYFPKLALFSENSVLLKKFLLLFLLAGTLSTQLAGQFYYGLRQEFGKNRVQYTDFDWVFYRFERYDVYFYRGNDHLASMVARMTEDQLPRIENLLDAPLDERVQILVFNNLSDLKQSNVNSSDDEDYNTTGVTRISGRRLFIYFNGNYLDLQRDLRSGLADVVLSNMMYGSFTKSIRNSALLNLPEWYTEGLVSYIGHPQDEEIDIHVRDAYLTGKYKNINSLIGQDARFAGHSLWEFVANTYGEKVLKNIVYMAIVNRNIESGFLYIIGRDLESIERDWKAYLSNKYDFKSQQVEDFPEEPLVKAPKGYRITHMALSSDGKKLAYAIQKFGRYKIYIKDLETGKRKRILTKGYRIAQNADYSYPLMAWHPEGNLLAMINEHHGFTWLNFYDLDERKWEEKQFFQFDKILSFRYSDDGKQFLLSANKNGQSDIFIYTILNTKIAQLTNDVYTDLNPAWIMGGKRVVWSSNRPADTVAPKLQAQDIGSNQRDLFSMPAEEPDDTIKIWRLTNTPDISEREAENHGFGYVSFISESPNGVHNRELIKIDSSIAYVDTATHYEYSFSRYRLTDYRRSLLNHLHAPESDINIDEVLYDGRYRLFKTDFADAASLNFRTQKQQAAPSQPAGTEVEKAPQPDSGYISNAPLYYPGVDASDFEVDIYDYKFEGQTEGRTPTNKPVNEQEPKPVQILPLPESLAESSEKEEPLEIPPKRNYFLSFYQDDFAVSFDNMFDNPQYQRFTGFVSGDLLNAGFNMNFKAGVMDLMHDYRVVGGFSTTFQPLNGTSIAPNSTFAVGVGDYKDRLDKNYTYTRTSQVLTASFTDYQRIITHQGIAKFSWPFNPVSSLRLSGGYRLDQTIQLARDNNTASEPSLYQDYLIGKLAYVYDNTRKIGLNLYSGLRYKIFTEYYRNLYDAPSGLHTAGIDFRNYTVIHRNFIWANRFAAGTSFGPQKLIYIMGGVDNQFAPSFEPTTPIARDNNYIFQTLVTNMRGFYQNVRNGNSFALINSELRLPIFSYLIQKPIRSDFIKNFQVIGFGDVGTAWNGWSPYSIENAINTTPISYNNLVIILDSQKEPIVASYGIGLRTRLFGYFLRFDWAWPVENGLILDKEFSFSLGYDF